MPRHSLRSSGLEAQIVSDKGIGRWDSDENAAAYDRYARTFPQYREMSRALVGLAEIHESDTVVDLACGTGITTEAILERLEADGRVVSVDASNAMIGVAKQRVLDSRVRWLVLPAEELAERVEVADVLVSNLAIWQTDLDRTVRGIRQVLRPGGRLAFNIPEGFVASSLPAPTGAASIRALMQQVAEREFGATRPELTTRRPPMTEEGVRGVLEKHGFALRPIETIEVAMTREDSKAWLSIPVFTEDQFPTLSYEQRLSVVETAFGAGAENISNAWRALAFIAT